MLCSVAVVDDHEVARLGLQHTLGSFDLVGEVELFASVGELLATGRRFDAVTLDLRLSDGTDPHQNATDIHNAGMVVLVYSALDSPYLLRRVMKAGVEGVVAKSAPVENLREALVTVLSGGTYVSAEWASAIDADREFVEVNLSPRQSEVLELYAMGESAKRVASMTGLSTETVQDYLTRIRMKYAQAGRPAQTKVELYRRAQEDGYLPGPVDVAVSDAAGADAVDAAEHDGDASA